jgi:hypothetical protein
MQADPAAARGRRTAVRILGARSSGTAPARSSAGARATSTIVVASNPRAANAASAASMMRQAQRRPLGRPPVHWPWIQRSRMGGRRSSSCEVEPSCAAQAAGSRKRRITLAVIRRHVGGASASDRAPSPPDAGTPTQVMLPTANTSPQPAGASATCPTAPWRRGTARTYDSSSSFVRSIDACMAFETGPATRCRRACPGRRRCGRSPSPTPRRPTRPLMPEAVPAGHPLEDEGHLAVACASGALADSGPPARSPGPPCPRRPAAAAARPSCGATGRRMPHSKRVVRTHPGRAMLRARPVLGAPHLDQVRRLVVPPCASTRPLPPRYISRPPPNRGSATGRPTSAC